MEDDLIGRPENSCYCNPENAESRRARGLPDGYCGLCDTEVDGRPCGRPGHMHSGPGPFTFAYCDEHPPGHFIHFGNLLIVGSLLVAGIGILLWLYL